MAALRAAYPQSGVAVAAVASCAMAQGAVVAGAADGELERKTEEMDMVETAIASITLPAELGMQASGPLVSALLEVRGRDVRIDASQVSRVGGQCLQVLLSAAATWDADGVALAIEAPSDAFVGTIRTAGLELARFTAPSATGNG